MVVIGAIAFAIGPSSKKVVEQSLKHSGDYVQNEDGTYMVLQNQGGNKKYRTITLDSIENVDAFVEANIEILSNEKSFSKPSYIFNIAEILDSETCLYEFEFYDYYTDLNVYYLNEKNKVVAYFYRFQTEDQKRAEEVHSAVVVSAVAEFASRLGRNIGAIGDVYTNSVTHY